MYPTMSLVIPLILTCLTFTPTPVQLIGGPATVMDADTIVVGNEQVDLEGIDAPETKQTCRRAGERYPCGIVAARALRARIEAGLVMCTISGQDPEGRLVGVCRLADRTDLGEWLVLNGHALADRRSSTRYAMQEDQARQEGVGLWAGEFVAPWDWRGGKRLEESG